MEKNDIAIREMRFDDLKSVFRLGEKLFDPDSAAALYRNWDEYDLLERFISDGEYCLVALNGKRLCGFVIGYVVKKRRSRWIYGYINWMGVEKKYQKVGVGKKLFNSLVRRFKKNGVNLLMADTSAENEKALKFFKRNGFDQQEEHVYLFKNLNK